MIMKNNTKHASMTFVYWRSSKSTKRFYKLTVSVGIEKMRLLFVLIIIKLCIMGKINVSVTLSDVEYTSSYEGQIADKDRVRQIQECMRSIHEQMARDGKDDPLVPMKIENEW